ncbi:hypothetical protein LZ198_14710 [Myxococcus sp. K15C18031901]|uniref:hypothetical protein n=1 Tax=Myxococcus dinghuensis TaxID=2906761 RepID=UPI0020A82F36|nr:hypothetical protein [Myxococcus dinghuensis]MCP3100125.1 hypothetical protein [Myxococcus dinghuensis]
MKRLSRSLATLAVLSSTAVLLVADSSRDCEHSRQDILFSVTENTCGKVGGLLAHSATDSCDVEVNDADAIGVPRYGESNSDDVDLLGGNWNLHESNRTLYLGADGGSVPADAGNATEVQVNRHCEAQKEPNGTLLLKCTDFRGDLSGEELASCQMRLTPP